MERLGTDRVHGRPVFLGELSTGWDWQQPGASSFTLLVAGDASAASDAVVRRYAEAAVNSGCGYVCAWGPDCERVHDRFDDAALERRDWEFMSTWHEEDGLATALYFALVLARPTVPAVQADAFVATVQRPWLSEVRTLLDDQERLARLYVSG